MTFNYKNVYLNETSTIAGPYELEGPIHKYYDKVYNDLYFNMPTFEQAEINMIVESVDILEKINTKYHDRYYDKEMEFKEEFKNDDEWNIEFYPKVKLGKIIKEVITNITIPHSEEFDDPNEKGIYLLRCDMDVSVGENVVCRKFSHQSCINSSSVISYQYLSEKALTIR